MGNLISYAAKNVKDVVNLPEEILPGLFKVEIPLPNNPLKALNSYVIKNGDESLIIDTGFNRRECIAALRAGLEELKIDLKKTKFFLTHMHADHSGLINELRSENSTVFASRADGRLISEMGTGDEHWNLLGELAARNGFPARTTQEGVAKHPGFKYGPRGPLAFQPVSEDSVIAIGNYKFKCVETPGHTHGHICLYEPEKKLLISGDHVLKGITPNISQWTDDDNMLATYLESLRKIRDIPIEIVLPGHRDIFGDCTARIDELISHHQRRAEEVFAILDDSGMTAYQVAGRMKWELSYSSWDDFPTPQKWFATGEAVAHLRYLQAKGRIRRQFIDNCWCYAR
jgi:glyoxylase-like metal-dependent hydrolase (beta-lactamase superfamily II)